MKIGFPRTGVDDYAERNGLRIARRFRTALAMLSVMQMALGQAFAQEAKATEDWRETYAYTLGTQAFIFGFPWIFLPQIRWQWVTQPKDPKWTPYAPLNQFWNCAQLATAAYRDGGSPNNDTLYSMAWLDLAKEPLILSVPDEGDRYYTMEMASLDSDNFAYVGTRTTGNRAGLYAIVGPNWKGALPEGVKALPASRTPYAVIFGRTLVYGPEDIANVNKLQAQYVLTPLSKFGKTGAAPSAADRNVWQPYDAKTEPLAVWKTMNRAMTENPPNEAHSLMVKNFATIGIGPGQDVEKMDAATKRGLERASVDGMKLLRGAIATGLGKKVNGWTYPPPVMGRAGLRDDFLLRASLQCLGGIIANDPEEAIYMNTFVDVDGKALSGANQYTMHFPPGELPKVKAFWSVTMYGLDNNLTPNPINRYKLGSYPKGEMKLDRDGGLTLYIQNESPGKDKETNWLPCPKDTFYLVLRTYMPEPELVKQEWTPAAVTKSNSQ
jgi:hypothetical protein